MSKGEATLEGYRVQSTVVRGFFTFSTAVDATFDRAVYLVKTLSTVASTDEIAASLQEEAQVFARDVVALPKFLSFSVTPAPELILERRPSVALYAQEVAGLSTRAKFVVAAQIFRAMSACHAREIHFRHIAESAIRIGASGVSFVDIGGFEGDRDDAPWFPPLEVRYASPEKILGEVIDKERSDLFIAALHVHQLFLGVHPFEGEGELSHNLRTQPPKQVAFDDDTYATAFRPIQRCLSKSPGDRPRSATEVIGEIEGVLGLEIDPEHASVASLLGLERPATTIAIPTDVTEKSNPGRRFELMALGFVWLLFIGLVEVWRRFDDELPAAPTSADPAKLYFVAYPWAEIWIDGTLIDTTPRARPWEVKPGRHEVLFKHPQAPDELRVVDASPGQIVRLDAEMKVMKPVMVPDAGDGSP
jgi:eukaryotic-like serine/threonine-protein kinase